MPTQKSLKSINDIQKKNTLDLKHQEFTELFQNENNIVIPELLINRKLLYDEYNYCKIDEKINIKFLIENIDSSIKNMKKNKKEYFLNNSKIIFEYFENKKNISLDNNENKTLIQNFFNIKDKNNPNTIVSKKSISNMIHSILFFFSFYS